MQQAHDVRSAIYNKLINLLAKGNKKNTKHERKRKKKAKELTAVGSLDTNGKKLEKRGRG